MIIVYGGCQADEPEARHPAAAFGSCAEDLIRPDPRPAPVFGAQVPRRCARIGRRHPLRTGRSRGGHSAGGAASLRRRDIPQDERGARWRALDQRLRPNHLHSQMSRSVMRGSIQPTPRFYRKHNIALLDKAEALARPERREVWVLAVRPKPDPSSPSVTDDLVAAPRSAACWQSTSTRCRSRLHVPSS